MLPAPVKAPKSGSASVPGQLLPAGQDILFPPSVIPLQLVVLFPSITELLTVSADPPILFKLSAPPELLFPENVLLLTVVLPLVWFTVPKLLDVLPVNVLFSMLTVAPLLNTALLTWFSNVLRRMVTSVDVVF